MDDELLQKVVQDISKNHSKIIDDWCKAYLAQKYQETGCVPKPGDFVLNQQTLPMDKFMGGYKYWFSEKE